MEQPTLTRRQVLEIGALGAAAVALPYTVSLRGEQASELPAKLMPRPYTIPFSPLPEIRPTRGLVEVTQAAADLPIIPGARRTTMWVYNGSFPGPTIKVRRNEPVTVRQINRMPRTHPLFGYEFTTSTHLHGAPSRPEYDGYANDVTRPLYFKDYLYPNTEDARTLWYHDHAVHHTANNVYTGLAAQYHLLPAVGEEDVGLPVDGPFDVPLIINDVAFRSDAQLLFDDRSTAGVMGDVILVNGVPWPVMQVEPRKYRFRLLNASIARGYRFRLGNGLPMTVIATDGGFQPRPQTVTELTMGMAERYEVIIDFADLRGRRVELGNLNVPNSVEFANTDKVMRFDVRDVDPASVDQTGNGAVPTSLPEAEVMRLTPAGTVQRRLRFEREDGEWTINGHTWQEVIASKFQAVIADPAPDAVETWTIENTSGGWFHPIHIHLVDFRVLDRDGRPPRPEERGPKDVVYLGEGQTIRLVMRFANQTGRYMMHCHNTSHEDHDMMFQFRVGPQGGPTDPDPISTAPPRPVSQLPV